MSNLWTQIFCTISCVILLPGILNAQENQRFPAPLGLNKVLSGTVSKAKANSHAPKDAARYLLTTQEGTVYQLHGHEKELRKMVGKHVRITCNSVGENVTVDSVEREQK